MLDGLNVNDVTTYPIGAIGIGIAIGGAGSMWLVARFSSVDRKLDRFLRIARNCVTRSEFREFAMQLRINNRDLNVPDVSTPENGDEEDGDGAA